MVDVAMRLRTRGERAALLAPLLAQLQRVDLAALDRSEVRIAADATLAALGGAPVEVDREVLALYIGDLSARGFLPRAKAA